MRVSLDENEFRFERRDAGYVKRNRELVAWFLTKLDAIPPATARKRIGRHGSENRRITFAGDRDRYLRITGQLYRLRETFRLFAAEVGRAEATFDRSRDGIMPPV